jgi:hypothetical protein
VPVARPALVPARRERHHPGNGQARKRGPLAPDLDTNTAPDILWIFNDPAHYAALVTRQGWTEHAFRGWLAAMMRSALLPG